MQQDLGLGRFQGGYVVLELGLLGSGFRFSSDIFRVSGCQGVRVSGFRFSSDVVKRSCTRSAYVLTPQTRSHLSYLT